MRNLNPSLSTPALEIGTWKMNHLTGFENTWSLWLGKSEGYKKQDSFLKGCIYELTWVSQVALVVKILLANSGDGKDVGWIPGSGRSPEGGHGNPLQYSCLENPVDRGAWQATVHGVPQCWTRLKGLSTHARMNWLAWMTAQKCLEREPARQGWPRIPTSSHPAPASSPLPRQQP